MRSERDGEYFCSMDNDCVNYSPFATYLRQQGIIPWYTTSATPENNGVAKRKKRT